MLKFHQAATAAGTNVPKSTVKLEAGEKAELSCGVGRVYFNGIALLPHEAVLLGSELERFGARSQRLAEEAASQARAGQTQAAA